MNEMETFHKQGYPIFGPNKEGAKLELERQYGQEIFKKCGMKIIPSYEFSNYNEAIKFVYKTKGEYVSKPDGDADKALSYVSKNPADMIFMLERWKESNKLKKGFILQEKVKGIEMAVGGWFGKDGWASNVNHNWEFKKLMNDDLGVATGEQGTILQYSLFDDSLLAKKCLEPLTDHLLKHNYIGFLDVNCMIGEDGTPWPLEFTCRPGWPHFQIVQALHKGDPADWMVDLIEGFDSMKVSYDVACGVVLSQPDYPYSTLTKKEVSGVPVYGITDKNRDHIHPAEMMLGEAHCMDGDNIVKKEMMVSAGDYVLVTSGVGKTVEKAREASYKVMKELEMPNSIMYRTDIGCRLEKQLPILHKLGYAEELKYD